MANWSNLVVEFQSFRPEVIVFVGKFGYSRAFWASILFIPQFRSKQVRNVGSINHILRSSVFYVESRASLFVLSFLNWLSQPTDSPSPPVQRKTAPRLRGWSGRKSHTGQGVRQINLVRVIINANRRILEKSIWSG